MIFYFGDISEMGQESIRYGPTATENIQMNDVGMQLADVPKRYTMKVL